MLELIEAAQVVAQDFNYKAYLVGGFVRDLILGVNNLDLDIAVEGEGIKFAEALAEKLNGKIISHKRFGTATITVNPHLKIDPSTPSFDKLRTSSEQSRGTLRVNGERSRTIETRNSHVSH